MSGSTANFIVVSRGANAAAMTFRSKSYLGNLGHASLWILVMATLQPATNDSTILKKPIFNAAADYGGPIYILSLAQMCGARSASGRRAARTSRRNKHKRSADYLPDGHRQQGFSGVEI